MSLATRSTTRGHSVGRYSRSREEQNREQNATLSSTHPQRQRPQSLNSSISVDRRVVLQPPSVVSILRRRPSPRGVNEPPPSLRRTTTRIQAGSYRVESQQSTRSHVRTPQPVTDRPRGRTTSETSRMSSTVPRSRTNSGLSQQSTHPRVRTPVQPVTDSLRGRTTSETSRMSPTVPRSRTDSGLSHPPATPPPRYATRPSSRQSQSGYASKGPMRRRLSQQSIEAAPRTVTLQAPSKPSRSPNLFELVRRLSNKRVRFKSLSSHRTISTYGTPPDSSVPRPTRVIRRRPSSTRLAPPPRPPPGLSHYQPVPTPRMRPRWSAQPPSPRDPPPVYPSRTASRARVPSPARGTITRTALPPRTAGSRSRPVHRIPSSTYLTPQRSSTRLRPPSPWSQHTFRASSSPRSTPVSPLDYDSDITPRVKRRSLFTPFARFGNMAPTGWAPWRNRKRSQEHAAFVDLPMGSGASLPRRKGLTLFGKMGGVPRLWKGDWSLFVRFTFLTHHPSVESTYGIPVLHPLLRASTLLRSSRITWDMRYPKLPQEYSLSPFVHKSLQGELSYNTNPSSNSNSLRLVESATQPPSKPMTILVPNPTHICWLAAVRPRSGSGLVSCIDVLRAAALLLRTPATPSEFAALRPSDQRLAERAFNVRCQAGEDMGQRDEGSERRIGMRKVDLLGRSVVWKGLRADKGGRGWVVALDETWI